AFEHIGSTNLLLQRLAELVEEARVLDGDDGLVGEVLDQLDLPVGERTDLLTINGDGADELIFLEHGHESQRADAGDIDCGNSQWMAVEIRLIFSQVSDLKRLSGLRNAAQRGCAAHRGAPPLLDICGPQRTVECSVAETISFFEPHSAVAASQSRVAFVRMASNTGCRSPGELEMTRSTSEVAVCCSSASVSSRVRASRLLTRALAFVLFERMRPRVALFAPLRDKVTSSARSLVLFQSASHGSSLSIL